MNPPASSPSTSVQIPDLEVAPNSNAESENGDEVLTIGNVSNNISNISNTFKKTQLPFNCIGVCKHKQLCRELGLYTRKGLESNNVGDFCDRPPCQINIVKGG